MFGIGLQELLVVAFIVLLLFGSRLPKILRALGSSLGAFREGLNDTHCEVAPAAEMNDQR